MPPPSPARASVEVHRSRDQRGETAGWWAWGPVPPPAPRVVSARRKSRVCFGRAQGELASAREGAPDPTPARRHQATGLWVLERKKDAERDDGGRILR